MIESINNKAKAETQRENGVTVYPTEEVLGGIKQVKDFAAFSEKHKTDIAQVAGHFLLEYCNEMNFTVEELKAFRLGLDCFSRFFSNCESDVKSYIMEAEAKNKRV